MRPHQTILVVDDNKDWAVTISGILQDEHYPVTLCSKFDEALRVLTTQDVPVAVIDIRLDEAIEEDEQGLLLLEEMQAQNVSTEVIITTGYGTIDRVRRAYSAKRPVVEYLDKGKENLSLTLINGVKRALRKHQLANLKPSRSINFLLSLTPGSPIHLRLEGSTNFAGQTTGLFTIDAIRFAAQSHKIYRLEQGKQRATAKTMGAKVHAKLFASHPEVATLYSRAAGRENKKRLIHLEFETSRELIGLPLEFLYDKGISDFLVLHHPMVHRVSGVICDRETISPEFIRDLDRRGLKLRVLIIAAQSGCVKKDIEEIGKETRELLSHVEWIDCRLVEGEDATQKNVRELLKENPYHLIHFIGNGGFIDHQPDRSMLLFDGPDGIERLKAAALRELLENSDTRLVLLTTCEGARTGTPADLRSDDHLGLSDAIILAGVPSVIGYRWLIRPDRARLMASAFYQSFINHGCPELALLDARHEAVVADRDELAWLAPVMIVQK